MNSQDLYAETGVIDQALVAENIDTPLIPGVIDRHGQKVATIMLEREDGNVMMEFSEPFHSISEVRRLLCWLDEKAPGSTMRLLDGTNVTLFNPRVALRKKWAMEGWNVFMFSREAAEVIAFALMSLDETSAARQVVEDGGYIWLTKQGGLKMN